VTFERVCDASDNNHFLGDFSMRKMIAAVTAGVLLVAGQAVAAGSNNTTVRVGDRIGASSGEPSEFAGVPLPVLLVGAALLVGAVVVASDDDSESD
jgi:hypothetical protein